MTTETVYRTLINDDLLLETHGYVSEFRFKSGAIQTATLTDVVLVELLAQQRKTNDILEKLLKCEQRNQTQ